MFHLTEREQKFLDKSWAKVFADKVFPAIDEDIFSVLYSDKASRPNTPVNIRNEKKRVLYQQYFRVHGFRTGRGIKRTIKSKRKAGYVLTKDVSCYYFAEESYDKVYPAEAVTKGHPYKLSARIAVVFIDDWNRLLLFSGYCTILIKRNMTTLSYQKRR